jgi:hypothetical protein
MFKSWYANDTRTLIFTRTDSTFPVFIRKTHGSGDFGHYFENKSNKFEVWIEGRKPESFHTEKEAQACLLAYAEGL